MKKKFRNILSCGVLILGMQFSAHAQYVLREADKAFEQYNFGRAIVFYEEAYKKNATLHAAQRLAESYKSQSNFKQTESWAAIAAGMTNSTPENTLEYAKALQSNSKYREAKEQYLKYASLKTDLDPKIKDTWLKSCDSSIRWMNNPRTFLIKNEKELNSEESDWGATVENGSIVFSSDRGEKVNEIQRTSKPFLRFNGANGPNKSVYSWTGNHYLRMYIKRKDSNVVMYPINAGTDYHVGPATFTAANDEAFFTITRFSRQLDYKEDAVLKMKQATVRVEIYSLTKDVNTGVWSKVPIPFKHNNVANYSVGDPFISANGKSLYFCSNMPGGKGGLDLYVSHRNDNGEWGEPINLGDINTEGNDRCPSIGVNGKFYFSTDGRVGMGGLDIFRAKIDGDKVTNPENLNYPLNSPQDDFAFTLISENAGYFSSNRFGGMGSDDIYSFVEQRIFDIKLNGIAYDSSTGKPLSNVVVNLSKDGEPGAKVLTNENGAYNFVLEKETSYSLLGDKTNYRSYSTKVNTLGITTSKILKQDLFLEPIVIGKAIKIENIYYDFDKSNIRPDAAIELDKLVKIMKDNPTIWIELGSHTDSRGNDQYNQWLAQSRANSAVQYIIDNGIEKARITAKGYGESRPVNKCTNGVKCSEADHQLNRRTEFTIVKQ